jgi:polyferredoxin
MLRKIRIFLAVVMMTLVTLLFLDFTGTLHAWLGWTAKVQFLPALLALNVAVVVALLALTLVFGRIYCSVVCPLGILQDLVASIRRKKNPYHFSKEHRWLRYGVLVVFAASFVAGLNSIVALLAPYSSYGRMAQNLLQPIWLWVNNLLASIAEHYGSYAFYHVDVWLRSLPTFLVALGSFAVIAILSLRGGRTYCNAICPVGTLLSFFARFSWLKVRFDKDKCRKCGKCERNCKAACIDFKNMSVDYSRCVACGNCLEQCSFDSLHYSRPTSHAKPSAEAAKPTEHETDTGRRSFLLGGAMATTAVLLAQEKKTVDSVLATIEDKVEPKRLTPLTPPGSGSAKNMQQRCTACQLCVSKCPNDVLRPSTDLQTLMQPTMSYERGYCRPECNRCSEVCPTGAIRPISLDVKSSTQIGHAVWVGKNCLPVTEGVECGNCARHCPVGAITMVPLDPNDDLSHSIPAVDETRCIGCGACEHLCPTRPFSAIYVEGHEVHREI